jgi:NAD(P)H-dependent FMN reductase
MHQAEGMSKHSKVIAIVGSYRKGGIIDSAVDEILASAALAGADVSKIYLADRNIEFCLNCRRCTQAKGSLRGTCVHQDDMASLLDEIEKADGLVLGSPVNFSTVTALTKRFIERLVCYAEWPWGARSPRKRLPKGTRKALLVTSCAMPGFLAPLFTGALRVLKSAAAVLGARPVGTLVIGLVAHREQMPLPARARARARRLGKRLVDPG